MGNSHRKRLSTKDGNEIMKKCFPDIANEPEVFQEIWEILEGASVAPSLSQALATMCDLGAGGESVIEIHKIDPWLPTPDEAVVMHAYLPNYIQAALLSFKGGQTHNEFGLTREFTAHLEKMGVELVMRSIREQEANRPGV